MTAKEMWDSYIQQHPEAAGADYEAWCYGSDMPDDLAQLTRDGIKTATASAFPLYELEKEPFPAAGEYNMILRTDGTALCVTRTTRVYVVPFRDVSAEQAWREGEGDRSLAYWRRVHEAFFREEMAEVGLPFTEDMGVVCEEFEVVFK